MPSLLEALEQKYGESSTESEGSDDEGISVAIFVPCKSPRSIVPSLLVLNDCDIATAGEKEALEAKCACVEELDLAKNKLKDWPEVFGILQQMPRLKFVNLSFNELNTPLKNVEVDRNLRWQQLRNLVLNSTYIDWESVDQILDHLPRLEELHLSMNDYNVVNLCKKNCDCGRIDNKTDNETKCFCPTIDYRKKHKHGGIRKLHFNGNPIDKWREVCKLGYAFPNLESLVLADCPIESLDVNVESDDEKCNRNYERSESECESGNNKESPHDSFRVLKFLNLNSTRLATWDDIERLSKFPALHCVRIQGCPLWESNEYTEHERRQLLIARLPNVEILNGGGVIGSDEREDAERAFIRYYMEKPESDRPERYFELVSIHGKLDPLVNVDLRPEKRVKVTFTCGSNSEVRSVDVYRSVSDLKTKLEAFAGFSAAKMRLFYVDQDLRDIQGPEEMKYPHKQLYSYNIQSGDEIIIDCKKKINEK
ncbi:tubulin-specific chaperone cofactor E-like protein [Tribolium castaneum]|uniref:Tubulin-specific chaperone cofactor E-like protein n=1 Tax=Tribolium castaneum TaxID=7070 RepID=D2A1Y4_TRICA|nr:PREDICTED: tubulin-specific chaperone cofactor E-like protein [Tribolium castaneum]XP_008191649.1 PREDICTED: tubulin-specific chaperone cofactor E-like protein [Tribolium castaneum]XP_008191650.1 PREDICTED: tubulin-specific chaperone cofactor E-like protein [Tribolium castaneum]XP_973523.2 PREDICTED: tubulin-specific chaperone cofactor E-like protein [Tribolium castaneum]EFA02067.1 Tubulin-specific chaperone cofactor E-like protein [Tribolium castaneum]|eukprot:XP_008191647.1 PREDICTED: tubulin-specific chaperone cofactor E-like protein [Tribolium castaneum]